MGDPEPISDHAKASKEAVKTLFLREMIAAGVLINASHNRLLCTYARPTLRACWRPTITRSRCCARRSTEATSTGALATR